MSSSNAFPQPSSPLSPDRGIIHVNSEDLSVQALKEQQLDAQAREIRALQCTAAHYRSWAAALQARCTAYNPDAARPARRAYLGNLPPGTNESELRAFVNALMAAAGACAAAGPPVVSCRLYSSSPEGSPGLSPAASEVPSPARSPRPGAMRPPGLSNGAPGGGGSAAGQDRSYAFVEFRSVEEASNCMALDGASFKGRCLQVRRPNNYDAGAAMMLGPTTPNPGLDLRGLGIVSTVVADTPHKLFVGGLPCDWGEEQVKSLLAPHGALKAFNLVLDKTTGNSKGYCFCEFWDVAGAALAIAALDSKPLGNKYLTAKRALAPM